MSGAPITVFCYRNGIENYGGQWITDRAALDRVRALAAEGGVRLVEDTIWYVREPWAKRISDAWPAVDSFSVVLLLDQDYEPPAKPAERARPKKSAAKKKKK